MPKKKKQNNLPYPQNLFRFLENPQHIGKIKDADGVSQVGNPVCGDVMYLYLKMGHRKGQEVIKDIKVQTYGCVAAIATSSTVAELAKGKTIQQAIDLTPQDILKQTGPLPPNKLHCSFLALDALTEALYDYLKKQKRPIPAKLKRKHLLVQEKQKSLKQRHPNWRG